jgi:riboflavin synthase alpha subunit
VGIDGNRFSVALIPTTLQQTVLSARRPGDRVNVETDILARVVVARLEAIGTPSGAPAGAELTWERLRESGFLS